MGRKGGGKSRQQNARKDKRTGIDRGGALDRAPMVGWGALEKKERLKNNTKGGKVGVGKGHTKYKKKASQNAGSSLGENTVSYLATGRRERRQGEPKETKDP